MPLLLKYLIVLTICVGSQDTTLTNNYHPDTSSRESKKCVVKQARINQMAEDINTKLDSMNLKLDRSLDEILRLLDEQDDNN